MKSKPLTHAIRVLVAVLALSMASGSARVELVARAQTTQWPTGTLDQILAPVALYPDSLLAQMLISAGDPAKITELDKWLKANTNLKGSDLQDAAVKAGFDASFVALAIFPSVVSQMASQMAWTTALGQAFTKDKSAVFDTIQKLRKQAKDVGTLKSTAQQEVETKMLASGEQVIVIEPTNPQIVYVPQYNTQVVYTQPPTQTVVVQQDNNADVAVAAGLIGFTAGIAIGAAMDNHYYYGPYGFHGGAYMYNSGWNDYWDHREDARDDWMDHREDVLENRNDRLENTSEQRAERRENTTEQRTERRENTAEQRTDRQQNRQENGTTAQAQQRAQSAATTRSQQQTNRTGSAQARGYSGGTTGQTAQRSTSSGTKSDAFSGYSSGKSQRAASSRGQSSRGSAASRGGGGRRR